MKETALLHGDSASKQGWYVVDAELTRADCLVRAWIDNAFSQTEGKWGARYELQ